MPTAVAAGALLLLCARPTQELQATGGSGTDTDRDGLADVQEFVLGTSTTNADSDFDGFSDLEEVTRQSDPLDVLGTPEDEGQRIGMAARVNNQILTFLTAIYVPDGLISSVEFEIGLEVDGIGVPVPSVVYLPASTVRLLGGGNPGSLIVLIETSLPEAWVHSIGSPSFYARTSQPGQSESIAVLDLLSFGGLDAQSNPLSVVMRAEPVPASVLPPPALPQLGTIYRPLTADERIPVDWVPGQICYQEMHEVGSNGVNAVYEIDSASCEPLDSFCSPSNCAAAVGQEIEFIDPGAIAGG